MVWHWQTVVELLVGVGLSCIIGFEREFNEKAAGVRTCALVGLGSTLFTAVSRHGMWILPGLTVTNVDGSRVAAQIVSGIGFLGAGLIFVRRDSVRGLTTAASVWLVAAIGMAAGAGVIDLAISATTLYLVVVLGIQPLRRFIPHSKSTRATLSVTYEDGHGVLRQVMELIGNHGLGVDNLDVLPVQRETGTPKLQRVRLEIRSMGGSIPGVVQELAEVPRVHQVTSLNRERENEQ